MTPYDIVIALRPIILYGPLIAIALIILFVLTMSNESWIEAYLKEHYPKALIITKQSGNDIERRYFIIQNDDKGYQIILDTSKRKTLSHKELPLSVENTRTIKNEYFKNTIKATH